MCLPVTVCKEQRTLHLTLRQQDKREMSENQSTPTILCKPHDRDKTEMNPLHKSRNLSPSVLRFFSATAHPIDFKLALCVAVELRKCSTNCSFSEERLSRLRPHPQPSIYYKTVLTVHNCDIIQWLNGQTHNYWSALI